MSMSESNIRNMLQAISQGNHVLNEQARFYKNEETDCPDCKYDPIRKESVDYDCETCGGKGRIVVEKYNEIPVSIETQQDFKYSFTNSGVLTEGEILLTVDAKEIKEVLNVNSTYNLDDHNQVKKFIEQYDYFIWKGGKYTLKEFQVGYLQGYMYEIALKLKLSDQ